MAVSLPLKAGAKMAAAAAGDEFLSAKVLGLPLWTWGLIVAGGLAAYYYVLPRLLNFNMAGPPLVDSSSQPTETTGGNSIDPSLVPGLGTYQPAGPLAYSPSSINGYTGTVPAGCVASQNGVCQPGFTQMQLTDQTVLCCPSMAAVPIVTNVPVPVKAPCPPDMHPCHHRVSGCCCNKPHLRNLGTHCAK